MFWVFRLYWPHQINWAWFTCTVFSCILEAGFTDFNSRHESESRSGVGWYLWVNPGLLEFFNLTYNYLFKGVYCSVVDRLQTTSEQLYAHFKILWLASIPSKVILDNSVMEIVMLKYEKEAIDSYKTSILSSVLTPRVLILLGTG